uniref:Uncharacterized protein n=1 Tax=Glossina brevipalpis TaxID=37001 RepID=A0A1A9X149_9MUSC
MKYLCCVWLFVICLVIYAQQFAMGLHIQRAPEIVERITRQATRYIGSGSGGVAQNYRPSQHLATAANYNKRTVPSNLGGTAVNLNNGQRTKGVGAYSFGGMASGRPSYGNTFAVNTAAIGPGAAPVGSIKSTNGLHSQLFNQQLQQHLLKAQQYQQQQNRPQQQQNINEANNRLKIYYRRSAEYHHNKVQEVVRVRFLVKDNKAVTMLPPKLFLQPYSGIFIYDLSVNSVIVSSAHNIKTKTSSTIPTASSVLTIISIDTVAAASIATIIIDNQRCSHNNHLEKIDVSRDC